MSGGRALRTACLAACALAAVAPALPGGGPRTRVLVVDRSRSLGQAAARVAPQLSLALQDLSPRDQEADVLAGAQPVVALAPLPRDAAAARLGEAVRAAPLDPWGSDLGAALDAARALAPGGEVLLVSDGRDTGGDLLAAAARLARAGGRLNAVAPDVPLPHGARLASLQAPARAEPGRRVPVEATAAVRRAARVTLTVVLEGAGPPRELARRQADLGAGERLRVAALTPPLPAGSYTVRARVRSATRDDAPEDDARASALTVGDGPRVVAVGPPLLPAALGAVRVTPAALPTALAAAPPDLVVLHEVPATAVAAAMPALSAAVRAGAGLVVAGSRRAFGPGAYGGSPLEELLPVTAGPGRERKRPLWLAVVLDASGSMGHAGRYQQAVEVGLPLELLRPEDRLAVLLFADEPEVVAPLGPVPPGLVERLARHEPGGGTDAGAALVAALRLLAEAGPPPAADLLVVLATDSEDPDPGRHTAALREAAAALAARTPGADEPPRVVLVRIGSGPAPALTALAEAVAPPLTAVVARAEQADAPLRRVLEGELLAQRAAVRAGPFPLRATAAAPAGLAVPARAAGYAPVQPRPEPARGAEVLVVAEDPELGPAPVAVRGRLGLGRVLALPLPADAAAPLLRGLWAGLLAPAAEGVTARAERAGRQVVVEAAAAAGALPPGAVAHLIGADGRRGELRLVPQGPSRASGRGPAPTARPLAVAVTDAAGRRLATAQVPDAAHRELAGGARPDLDALSRAAAATGGRLLPALPAAARPLAPPATAAGETSLRPLLAGLALALLLLEAAAAAWRTRRAGLEATSLGAG